MRYKTLGLRYSFKVKIGGFCNPTVPVRSFYRDTCKKRSTNLFLRAWTGLVNALGWNAAKIEQEYQHLASLVETFARMPRQLWRN